MSIKFYHKINGYSNLQINDNVKNSSKYLQKPKRCSALNELISELIQNLKKKILVEKTPQPVYFKVLLFSEPRKSQRNESQTLFLPI